MNGKEKINYRGITLIALIITIIVMLILISVTVTIALNSGLFSTAKKAARDTGNAVLSEQSGKIEIAGEEYESIDEYLSKDKKDTGPLTEATNIKNYGRKVINFQSKGEEQKDLVWRLLYEDDKNIYLISETSKENSVITNLKLADYLNDYKNGADVSKQGQDLMVEAKNAGLFESSNENENIRATAYLCDTGTEKRVSPWDNYRDAEGKAVWAMGGPTIELFAASYNATQDKTLKATISEGNSFGYDCLKGYSASPSVNDGVYKPGNVYYYWLASPKYYDKLSLHIAGSDCCGVNQWNDNVNTSYGCRPVVCIPKSNFSCEFD